MRRAAFALAVALAFAPGLAAPTAAGAAEQPPTAPLRDADITYRSFRGAQPFEERMRWQVESQRMRLDPPVPGLYLIVDYAGRKLIFVDADKRRASIADAPSGPPGAGPAGPGMPAGSDYVHEGEDNVAGTPCTEWRTTDLAGQPVQVCISADGLLLRARVAGKVTIEAVSVHIGPQNPADFRVPPGFAHIAEPKP